ncbi:MAG: BrnA antitoxin family protein [Sulfitobacter sp.]
MHRKDAHTQMVHELERLQEEIQEKWLDQSIPPDWHGLDFWDDVKRKKTRVTIRLDADMVAWFRKMGPNYGPRINKVLRIYYAGIVSGNVSAYPNDRVIPRMVLAAQQEMDALRGDLIGGEKE